MLTTTSMRKIYPKRLLLPDYLAFTTTARLQQRHDVARSSDDVQDQDIFALGAIDNHISSHRKTPQSRPQVVPQPAHMWMAGKQKETFRDGID